MEPVVVAVISAVSAISVGLVGQWVARRKGMPGINAEIEQRMQVLVDTLRGDLQLRTDDLARKVSDLEACRAELVNVRRDLRETKADLRDTEGELLELYRKTGRKPPQRLTDAASDG